jgi:Tfp pilus assembly protein PilW
MKAGAISLLVIAAVVWIFWMTVVAVKRTKKKKEDK